MNYNQFQWCTMYKVDIGINSCSKFYGRTPMLRSSRQEIKGLNPGHPFVNFCILDGYDVTT